MLSLKQKIIAAIIIIGLALIAIFQQGLGGSPDPQLTTNQEQNSDIKIVFTSPDPLEGAVILPSQTMEVTFNQPIENSGEFKNKLEPAADYKVELSEDRKTVKLIPNQPLNLGTGFTWFISGETKFDGGKRLPGDLNFHFRTIDYKGV